MTWSVTVLYWASCGILGCLLRLGLCWHRGWFPFRSRQLVPVRTPVVERQLTAAEIDVIERECEIGPYSPEARAAQASIIREQALANSMMIERQNAEVLKKITVLKQQGRDYVKVLAWNGRVVDVRETSPP